MYIVCGLGRWGSSSLFHLVCKQEELQHRVDVLHDGLFHPFLQQVPFCLNLCVFLPLHCLHGGLQEPQAHQHRALGRRKVEKWGSELEVEQTIRDHQNQMEVVLHVQNGGILQHNVSCACKDMTQC